MVWTLVVDINFKPLHIKNGDLIILLLHILHFLLEMLFALFQLNLAVVESGALVILELL